MLKKTKARRLCCVLRVCPNEHGFAESDTVCQVCNSKIAIVLCKLCKQKQTYANFARHIRSCLKKHLHSQSLVTVVHYKHKQTIPNLNLKSSKEKFQYAIQFAKNEAASLFASYHETAPFTITRLGYPTAKQQNDCVLILEDSSVSLYETQQFKPNKYNVLDFLSKFCENEHLFFANAIEIDEEIAKKFNMPKDTIFNKDADKIVMYIEYNIVSVKKSFYYNLGTKTRAGHYYSMFLEYGIGSLEELSCLTVPMISGLNEEYFNDAKLKLQQPVIVAQASKTSELARNWFEEFLTWINPQKSAPARGYLPARSIEENDPLLDNHQPTAIEYIDDNNNGTVASRSEISSKIPESLTNRSKIMNTSEVDEDELVQQQQQQQQKVKNTPNTSKTKEE